MASELRHPRRALALALALAAVPAAAAAPAAPEEGAWIRLRDQRIVELLAARGDVPALARARDASRALEAAVAADPAAEATVERAGGEAVVKVGGTVVLRLGPEDAAAEAAPLAELADRTAAALRQALARERRRLAAHDLVYTLSMVVFSGLVALLFVRWLGRAALSAADRLEAAGTRIPALEVGGVELLSAPLLRGGAAFGLRLGRFVAQLAVVLAWALSVLGRFEATRGARDLLADALVRPLLELGAKLLQGVPLVLGLAIVTGFVALVVRAAGTYFDAVARGDAGHAIVPRDLAPSLGRLVRAGVALAAILVVAAAIGGDGLLAGLARAIVLGLGLAGAPILASALAGLPLLLGRVLRPGDLVETGGQRGRVVEVGVLSVLLEDERGARVRVPHLLSLFRPTRVEREAPGARR